jgi:PAS domain S-box-containing protein
MSEERRPDPRPDTTIGYLEQLPALVVLQRLPVPILAVGNDGTILYANPACVAMLGQGDDGIVGRPLNQFLDMGATTTQEECFDILRAAAGTHTVWHHTANGTVKALTSQPLLMRADDPLLLVSLTDVTDWLWTFGRAPSATSAADC